MAFSGAVKLVDLSDYLTPSQNCVAPLISEKKSNGDDKKTKVNIGKAVEVSLDVPTGAHFGQIHQTATKTATVTLNDCLACSGCVTTAESVLIKQQSAEEFMQSVRAKKMCVVTISPQSLLSLAADLKLTPIGAARKLTAFFKGLGAHFVFGSGFAQDIAIMESREEFVQLFKAAQNGKKQGAAEQKESKASSSPSPAPSPSPSASSDSPQQPHPSSASSPPQVCVLCSECPGWVCYAEKTQGQKIIPYMSTTKSPQQIMGTIVKRRLAAEHHVDARDIYHVTVMPCYDKKLEASRNEFYDAEQQTRDVDCVLATIEVVQMLTDQKVDLATLPDDTKLDTMWNVTEHDEFAGGWDTGASGGYLDAVFRYAAQTLFGMKLEGALDFKVGRTADMREVTLEVDGRPVMSGALVYGFRNIQNLTQKLKRGRCTYNYVEVMACPSGCLNGGGQIRAKDLSASKDLLATLDQSYQARVRREPEDNKLVQALYKEWLDAPYSARARELLHTSFHAVEKRDVPAVAIQW